VFGGVIKFLSKTIGAIVTFISDFWSAITTLMDTGDFTKFVKDVGKAFGKMVMKVVEGLTAFIETSLESIGRLFVRLGSMFLQTLRELWTGYINWLDGIWSKIVNWIDSITARFSGWLLGMKSKFAGFFGNMVSNFAAWIGGVFDFSEVTDKFMSLANTAFEAGKTFVSSLMEGIRSMWGDLVVWIEGLWSKVTGIFTFGNDDQTASTTASTSTINSGVNISNGTVGISTSDDDVQTNPVFDRLAQQRRNELLNIEPVILQNTRTQEVQVLQPQIFIDGEEVGANVQTRQILQDRRETFE
jgi:phage-related protein